MPALAWGTYESGLFDLGAQAIIKNKWSATLSYQGLSMRPKNRPADYQPETGYVLFIPYTYEAGSKHDYNQSHCRQIF